MAPRLSLTLLAMCGTGHAIFQRSTPHKNGADPLMEAMGAMKQAADTADPFMMEVDAEMVRLPTKKERSKFWESSNAKGMAMVGRSQGKLKEVFGTQGELGPDAHISATGLAGYEGKTEPGQKPTDYRLGLVTGQKGVYNAEIVRPDEGEGGYLQTFTVDTKGGHLTNEQLAQGTQPAAAVGRGIVPRVTDGRSRGGGSDSRGAAACLRMRR
eukprot:CAMPEP_0197898200 /NCGR_PEP_ID=MMETSP1439-20131203/43475_1 /TAXON_ID=66791 /ORGANISM="Gonyaulax spinifera, Strain CCMP409" /LENGTH=211 /DNA_ID=CAMNT_0043518899 /DNA_START=69 /DNA_END=700 /DNA_ORIENTATION=+